MAITTAVHVVYYCTCFNVGSYCTAVLVISYARYKLGTSKSIKIYTYVSPVSVHELVLPVAMPGCKTSSLAPLSTPTDAIAAASTTKALHRENTRQSFSGDDVTGCGSAVASSNVANGGETSSYIGQLEVALRGPPFVVCELLAKSLAFLLSARAMVVFKKISPELCSRKTNHRVGVHHCK